MVNAVNDITYTDVAGYLREDVEQLSDNEIEMIKTLINSAVSYIKNYTGEDETVDTEPDFVPVVYILCQDMWDNRTLYVEKGSVNKTVQTILDMHTGCNIA